jgi:hypothetical protein
MTTPPRAKPSDQDSQRNEVGIDDDDVCQRTTGIVSPILSIVQLHLHCHATL